MGFLNGRITYVRYRVGGTSPLPFGEETLEQAQLHAIGRHGAGDSADGVAVGWSGGDHVLDVTLEPGKNLINDAFHLAIRVDTDLTCGFIHERTDGVMGQKDPIKLLAYSLRRS